MIIQDLQQPLLNYALILPRLMACFVVLPILGKQVLGGALIRNGILCSLAIFIYPLAAFSMPAEASGLEVLLLVGKEALIGLLIGFVAGIPFWAIEATGFIVDTQRGASMASLANPMLASQSSPTGVLLTQTLITLFYSGGVFLVLLSALFKSYASWPIGTFYPQVSGLWVEFFYGQISQLFKLFLLMSAPLLIAMFLAEFGLALISRFAPSLNVFILSMPIKCLVASLLLVLYLHGLMDLAYNSLLHTLSHTTQSLPITERP